MSTDTPPSQGNASQAVIDSLQNLIKAEVDRACTALKTSLDNAPAPDAPAEVDLDSIRTQLEKSDAFTQHINECLQEGLKNVMPGLLKRLKDTLGGEEGGSVCPSTVVDSVEMKEMLEDRFRQMLLYLKQEVIPKEVEKSLQK